jgi:hypothetical protein
MSFGGNDELWKSGHGNPSSLQICVASLMPQSLSFLSYILFHRVVVGAKYDDASEILTTVFDMQVLKL